MTQRASHSAYPGKFKFQNCKLGIQKEKTIESTPNLNFIKRCNNMNIPDDNTYGAAPSSSPREKVSGEEGTKDSSVFSGSFMYPPRQQISNICCIGAGYVGK
jgi:hypothetical protein